MSTKFFYLGSVISVMAVAAVIVLRQPAPVSAEALDCQVAQYRRIEFRLWQHDKVMTDRNCFCDLED
ncbi:hypothetical protein A3J20_07150 [Candidatus Gottesmanbacteria bacterium RIFCSPLOWO2_02_FULL_42_29]|uniref:Uncharacterized protein n=1 Tax=Candidatus Gottesmanbacteria bacterium RIFCSPLOWO2_01_FULL_42_22 TaxID=1798391 RepID=A0A1F6B913_9BACT|nr:MAG: hypothetical protein A2781_01025 [Candidatus Gottesmanbacteria bacterium RIFCSPHIGHO2_01_FULL_42_27]OGG20293.1 MAG: hypothetical protein A3E72_04150 [Candidatus Gottesmanbacteria bacterium RIFCSPHIGHO2_12_FULL_43_26]OGG33430.1 MAG: hypothetical protein A2968_02565 [Candidatus Gottesmanbacteria bacterium RIFCSPLOWO2_01_FULL_42_22]OGG33834.1 MAG: hypothetical protein A3G68_04645 [Candidatus Gottesmanbacteria bacterium RIFCSPLOWO2_12_FULL_42_10]OGG38597.1 MAG: hypothetical protein A3J20_07